MSAYSKALASRERMRTQHKFPVQMECDVHEFIEKLKRRTASRPDPKKIEILFVFLSATLIGFEGK